MTEEAKRCVEALRDNINNGFWLVGGFNGSVHASEIIHLIESLSKQLDDQTVVIDRIYEQCKTLQNDLKELGFDSIADMYAQLEQTENKLSELLSYATGGRFSKADYSIDDMRRFVDDYNQSECNECDQLEEVEKERDGLNIMLAQAQAMLETRTKERDAAIADLREADLIDCMHCKAYNTNIIPCQCDCENCKIVNCACKTCVRNSNWQWRGVREVQ